MKTLAAMKINWFSILIFGVNVIVCLPQSNQHESSLDVTAENDKSTEDKRSLRGDNLKNKEENTTDANNIKNEVQETTSEIVDTKEKVDVLNMSKGMHTNQRLLPINYGQAEQAVPHRWLPAPPRYIIPVVPRASEQVFTTTYDAPFEKDVREPEVVAESHINEPVIKTPSNNPIETIYMVPPQIAYTPGPAEAIIPTPYLAPIPVDPGYNSQETGLPTKPWIYSSSFVQPRYFRINGQQPYYRHPVQPLSRYNPVNVFPPPFNYGTTLYQEPVPPTTLEERSIGDLHDQGLGKNAGDNNDGRKYQINVPENLADFVRYISKNNVNNDGYPIYYPSEPHNTDDHNNNSQANNNFESPVIDTTMISGYVNPDTANDFSNFDHGYPMYFPLSILERNPRVIYSPYQNLGPKKKQKNTLNNSDDSSFSHNDDNVTHEPDINGQNHQSTNNPEKKLKINNDYENLHAEKIKELLSDPTDISYNNSHLNHAPSDSIDFANESKSATIIERKDRKQEPNYVSGIKQHDSSEGSISKEAIESSKPVLNDTIESQESRMDTHIIFTDNAENVSIISLKTQSEEKNQESLNITNKNEDEMMSTEIGTPESFENMKPKESTTESRSIYLNEFIHKDSTETKSTETTAKMNNDDNLSIGTDIYEKDVTIETTQLQPIEKEQYDDQDTGTPQIEASIEYSDMFILNNGNRSNAGTENVNNQIIEEENPLVNRNEINSNQPIETITVNKKQFNKANDVQPTYYMEEVHNDGGPERIDDPVEVTIKKDDTKYNNEININQVENGTATPENLSQKKSSENNDEEEYEKSNPKTDKQDNTKYENTFSETTSDNNNSRESGENSDNQEPQIEDKRHDKETLDIINDVILNPETVESKNESNNNDVGDKDLGYPKSEISTNNSSSQISDEKSVIEQSKTKGAMQTDTENDNTNNKHRIFETISPKNSLIKDEIDISEKESESNKTLDEYEDYDKNNKDMKKITIENKENNVKLSPHNPENIVDPDIDGTDLKSYIDPDINKNPVGDTHEKEDTWYSDKDVAAIDVNLNPKIIENDEITKFNYGNSENRSEVIDIELVEEKATAIEKTTCLEQDILAPSISDNNSKEDINDGLNDADENNDDFDVISSVSQITNEESIKSKLGFETTCITHPVDISTNDDSKNAAKPMRLEFYRKIFEEYYKNHNVIPLTVIQKNIRRFVYKNGTVVNVITSTVWNVENDKKPVELRTSKTIKYRKKKNC